jgi:hypothetical protein
MRGCTCLLARRGESLDGLTNKPLELEGVVATAGGNRPVSARVYKLVTSLSRLKHGFESH